MDNFPNQFNSKPFNDPVVVQTNIGAFEIDYVSGLGYWLYEYPKGHHKKSQFTRREQTILDAYRGVARNV